MYKLIADFAINCSQSFAIAIAASQSHSLYKAHCSAALYTYGSAMSSEIALLLKLRDFWIFKRDNRARILQTDGWEQSPRTAPSHKPTHQRFCKVRLSRIGGEPKPRSTPSRGRIVVGTKSDMFKKCRAMFKKRSCLLVRSLVHAVTNCGQLKEVRIFFCLLLSGVWRQWRTNGWRPLAEGRWKC